MKTKCTWCGEHPRNEACKHISFLNPDTHQVDDACVCWSCYSGMLADEVTIYTEYNLHGGWGDGD